MTLFKGGLGEKRKKNKTPHLGITIGADKSNGY